MYYPRPLHRLVRCELSLEEPRPRRRRPAALLRVTAVAALLWGANYYPGRGVDGCIEYTSLINIRPAQGNRSMLVQDSDVCKLIRELTFALIGDGEPLS